LALKYSLLLQPATLTFQCPSIQIAERVTSPLLNL